MTDPRLIASVAVVLSLQITLAFWFLPQKWQACQKLYSNTAAQIICLGSK